MARPTDHELELIKEIRSEIADLHLDPEYLEAKNLVRFLRARNEHLDQAEEMIRKNVHWMDEHDVENALAYDPPPGFKDNFPWSPVGFDNLGGPLVILPMGKWNTSKVSGMLDEYIKLSIQYFETVWRIMKLQSKGSDHIKQFTCIIDLQGLGWRHYTSYDGLQGTLTMVKYFEANYPETIRLGVFVNAPSIFNLFWNLIKPMVSTSTHNKLHFLGSNKKVWRETLTKFAKEDQIPKSYGGTLSDSYEICVEKLGAGKYVCHNGNECIYGQ